MRMGISALQGAFLEHRQSLEKLGIENIYVKTKEDLDHIAGIILPDKESTAMGKLLRELEILEKLKRMIEEGLPVFWTCSGMILLVYNDKTCHLGTMNIEVRRNAYGRQLGSFSYLGDFNGIENKIKMVFIRAPYVETVGERVKVLAKVNGKIVTIKERNMLAIAFHPELIDNLSLHKYFLTRSKKFVIY